MMKEKFLFALFLFIIIQKNTFVNSNFIDYKDVVLQIYTRENPFCGYTIYYRNRINLHNSPFDPIFSTKFVIHGFQSSCKDDIFILIKDAFLQNNLMNVICVDWSYFAEKSYAEAITNTWFVGVFLSLFIQWLVYETGLSFENIHLIGHSLGAHVAGVAGSEMKLGIIEKITGLDPAVPFINFNPVLTLDMSDAKVVEIFFTSVLSNGHPFGNVNIIINGGIEQPDCKKYRQSERYFTGGPIFCSHSRAYQIYAANIKNPYLFSIFQCENLHQTTNNQKCKEIFHSILELQDGVYSVTTNNFFC